MLPLMLQLQRKGTSNENVIIICLKNGQAKQSASSELRCMPSPLPLHKSPVSSVLREILQQKQDIFIPYV